jgi:hypothetical protein
MDPTGMPIGTRTAKLRISTSASVRRGSKISGKCDRLVELRIAVVKADGIIIERVRNRHLVNCLDRA